MWTVFLCLVPAGVAGFYYFGWYAAMLVGISVVSCVVVEALIQALTGRPVRVADGSAAVTGLLLAFVLPPNVPWYEPVLGAVVAIGIAKEAFGGLGNNIWNPALVGRAFLQFAHAPAMSPSEWPLLKAGRRFLGDIRSIGDADNLLVDAESYASALFKPDATTSGSPFYKYDDLSYGDLFWGQCGGCIGETCAVVLLLGALFLVMKRYVRWHVPVLYVGTVALLAWALPFRDLGWFGGDPLYHVLSGGLVIGAFFMATDMVTTPLTGKGMAVFAVGAGILTALIRLYGGFPEGVCYSILLMNTATPLIDRWTKPRVFGSR
jgi:electron transport complex protein RnfD